MHYSRRMRITPISVYAFFLLLSSSTYALAQAGSKETEPLAVVAGQTITSEDLLPFIQVQVFQLRLQEYELRNRALENAINQKLVELEAKKKGIPAEKLLEQDVDAKLAEPTEGELQALFI